MDRRRRRCLFDTRSYHRPGHHVVGGTSIPVGHHGSSRLRQHSGQRFCTRKRIQRPVGAGLRGSVRHGAQRFHFQFHHDDLGGSRCHRRRLVLYRIQEGEQLGLSDGHHQGRNRPRPRDHGQHHHRRHAGHRGIWWRICQFLSGNGGSVPARHQDHVEAGRTDPGELESGIRDDRQRNGRQPGDGSCPGCLPGRHRRPSCAAE